MRCVQVGEDEGVPIYAEVNVDEQMEAAATEDWIKERWGGFWHLVIGRNDDFMLDFCQGQLWLHYENNNRGDTVGRLLLFERPTQQNVEDAERMFGCR